MEGRHVPAEAVCTDSSTVREGVSAVTAYLLTSVSQEVRSQNVTDHDNVMKVVPKAIPKRVKENHLHYMCIIIFGAYQNLLNDATKRIFTGTKSRLTSCWSTSLCDQIYGMKKKVRKAPRCQTRRCLQGASVLQL